MEIIRRGKLPENEIIISKCPQCYTIFKYGIKEGIAYIDKDGNGVKIACPVCKNMVWHNF